MSVISNRGVFGGSNASVIRVFLGLDTRHFVRGMKVARRALGGFARSSNVMILSLKRTLTSLKALALTVFAGVLAKGFLDVAANMEQLQMALEKLTQGRGKATFEALNKWAKMMPVNTEKAIAAFRLLLAYHLSPTIQDMTTIVDTVSALGGSTDTLEGIARALGQIAAKGRPMQQEMNQLSERGVPALEILQQKLGLLPNQVADIGRQGLKSATVLRALMEGMREWSGGLSELFMQTWKGQMERLKSWIVEFKRVSMNLGPFQFLKSTIEDFLQWLDSPAGTASIRHWAANVAKIILDLAHIVLTVISQVTKFAAFAMRTISQFKNLYRRGMIIGYDYPVVKAYKEMIAAEKARIELYNKTRKQAMENLHISPFQAQDFKDEIEKEQQKLYQQSLASSEKLRKKIMADSILYSMDDSRISIYPRLTKSGEVDLTFYDGLIKRYNELRNQADAYGDAINEDEDKIRVYNEVIKSTDHIYQNLSERIRKFRNQVDENKAVFFPGPDQIPGQQGIGFELPGRKLMLDYNNIMNKYNLLEKQKLNVSVDQIMSWRDSILGITDDVVKGLKDRAKAKDEAVKQLATFLASPSRGGGQVAAVLAVESGKGFDQYKSPTKAAKAWFEQQYGWMKGTNIHEYKKKFDIFVQTIKRIRDEIAQAASPQDIQKAREDLNKILNAYAGIPLKYIGPPPLEEALKRAKEMIEEGEKRELEIRKTYIQARSSIAKEYFTNKEWKDRWNEAPLGFRSEITSLNKNYDIALKATEGNLAKREGLYKIYTRKYAEIWDKYYSVERDSISNMKYYFAGETDNIYKIQEKNAKARYDALKKYYTESKVPDPRVRAGLKTMWDQGVGWKAQQDLAMETQSISIEEVANRKRLEEQLQHDLVGIELNEKDRRIAIMKDQLETKYEMLKNYLGDSMDLQSWYNSELRKIEEARHQEMVDNVKEFTNFFIDSFTRLVSEGKLSFKSLADSFVAMIIRMEMRWMQARFMEGFKTSLSSGGGIWSAVGAGLAGIFGGSSKASWGTTSMKLPGGIARASGGWIDEPVLGIGLNSGKPWTFGEQGPEMVVPGKNVGQITGEDNKRNTYQFNVTVQALDTETGLDYMRKNPAMIVQPFIEAIEAGDRGIINTLRKAGV